MGRDTSNILVYAEVDDSSAAYSLFWSEPLLKYRKLEEKPTVLLSEILNDYCRERATKNSGQAPAAATMTYCSDQGSQSKDLDYVLHYTRN